VKRAPATIRLLTIATLAIVTASACGRSNDGPPAPQSSDARVLAGFELAKRQACFSCHQVAGEGGKSGPALDDTSQSADAAYLRESLTDPDAQIAEGYRKGVMSAAMTGKKFTEEQLDDLVAYLQALRAP
jgi:mono/diheme cytochrome c family protein